MFGQGPRGALRHARRPSDSHTNPQRSSGRHGIRGISPKLAEFAFPRTATTREGAMQFSTDHSPSNLPKKFPIGTTYVVEGRGGEAGELQVYSRYVVLPGGRRI